MKMAKNVMAILSQKLFVFNAIINVHYGFPVFFFNNTYNFLYAVYHFLSPI